MHVVLLQRPWLPNFTHCFRLAVLLSTLHFTACKSPPSPGYGAIEVSITPTPLETQSAIALVYTRNPKTFKRTILERREIDASGKIGFVLKTGMSYGVQVFWDDNQNGLREASELQASQENLTPSAPWQESAPIEFNLPPPASALAKPLTSTVTPVQSVQ